MQIAYLIKDLYPQDTKNAQNSTVRKQKSKFKMARLEHTLHQRCADGKEAHEKMQINTTNTTTYLQEWLNLKRLTKC